MIAHRLDAGERDLQIEAALVPVGLRRGERRGRRHRSRRSRRPALPEAEGTAAEAEVGAEVLLRQAVLIVKAPGAGDEPVGGTARDADLGEHRGGDGEQVLGDRIADDLRLDRRRAAAARGVGDRGLEGRLQTRTQPADALGGHAVLVGECHDRPGKPAVVEGAGDRRGDEGEREAWLRGRLGRNWHRGHLSSAGLDSAGEAWRARPSSPRGYDVRP